MFTDIRLVGSQHQSAARDGGPTTGVFGDNSGWGAMGMGGAGGVPHIGNMLNDPANLGNVLNNPVSC